MFKIQDLKNITNFPELTHTFLLNQYIVDIKNVVDKLIINDVEEIRKKIDRFGNLFNDIQQNQIPYLAYIIDIGVDHINNAHTTLPVEWKAFAIVLVIKLFLTGKINDDDQIKNIIDDFIMHWENDYEQYSENIIATTEYDRKYGFVFNYYLKT